ncbi:MAG: transposase [Chitinispirillaceae bacterium]
MCTKPRIIVPDVYYQVTSKGVSGEKIFSDNEMKRFFLKELSKTLEKYAYDCCCWSLMDDHYHLVVKSSEYFISKFMQRLNSVCAKKYNRINGREGVVFFRRYASLISDETELKKLIRYVHLNPVRCGDCTLEQLDRYEWCGHKDVITENNDGVLNRKSLLNQFVGSDPVKAYKNYIAESDYENDEAIGIVRNANKGKLNFSKPECWVLGNEEFIRMILHKDSCRKARIARHMVEGITLEQIHQELRVICLCYEEKELFLQGRKNQKSTARELFAYLGVCCYDFRNTEAAEYLKITASAVSRMVSRYSGISEGDYLEKLVCGNSS